MYMKTATSALEAIKTSNTLTSLEFYSAVKDVLSLWLDHQVRSLLSLLSLTHSFILDNRRDI
jgi:hypothetical protein